VLGDVLKTRVYDLARWINENHHECGFQTSPIPAASLSKPPSAELRPDQTDQDTLPPYHVLDRIIEHAVESEDDETTIVARTGFPADLVGSIVRMIDRSQFKRDQAPVVLKVTGRAFGPGRPMPLAMKSTPWPANGQGSHDKGR